MILKTFSTNDKWYAEIYDESGTRVIRSGAEYRVGCAIRSALNMFERGYGKPSTDIFIIDLGEW